jgi:hypothetical protein
MRKILSLQSLSVSRSSHRGRVDLLLDSVPVCLRWTSVSFAASAGFFRRSGSSVQLKDAAEKVGREVLDLLLLLRRGLLLLLLLSTIRLLQYRSTVAGTVREIFFSFCDDDNFFLFYQKSKCVFPYFWFFFANLETSAIMHLTNEWGCERDNTRCILRTMLWLLFLKKKKKKKKKTASEFVRYIKKEGTHSGF